VPDLITQSLMAVEKYAEVKTIANGFQKHSCN
jgi:hypothetical protein